jgi:hypothetical protein
MNNAQLIVELESLRDRYYNLLNKERLFLGQLGDEKYALALYQVQKDLCREINSLIGKIRGPTEQKELKLSEIFS